MLRLGASAMTRNKTRQRFGSLMLAASALRGWSLVSAPVAGARRQQEVPRGSTQARAYATGRGETARQISDFSTSELKRLLTERGVDFRDCLEKSELVQRLQQSLREGDPGGSSGEASTIASLTAPEQQTVRLFQSVAPSVAFITTLVVRQASPLSLRGIEVPAGSGSGFVWDTKGHVVTNYHVIQQAQKAQVAGIGEGDSASISSYDAVLVGAEPEKDIAVLKVNAPAKVLKPIVVGSSSDLLVGQSVFAIGNPFGLDHTLTQGLVSAVGREVQGVAGRPIKGCIQTDAAINPGNSGGPLLDAKGRLIGVNTAIYSPSGASAGIGFAIPVDTVRRIVNQLIRYGRVLRPSLGISVADDQVTRSLGVRLGASLEGVLVLEAPRGSPGAEAGLVGCMRTKDGQLVLGDLITQVNGNKVKTVEDLLTYVEEVEVGTTVTLTVARNAKDGKVEEVKAKTVDRAQLARA